MPWTSPAREPAQLQTWPARCLQSISATTGGRWYSSDDIDRAAAGARADARGSYVIAYHTPILEKDKRYHKIRVDSPRKGILFKTRDGYPGDTPEPKPMRSKKPSSAPRGAAPSTPQRSESGSPFQRVPKSTRRISRFTSIWRTCCW